MTIRDGGFTCVEQDIFFGICLTPDEQNDSAWGSTWVCLRPGVVPYSCCWFCFSRHHLYAACAEYRVKWIRRNATHLLQMELPYFTKSIGSSHKQVIVLCTAERERKRKPLLSAELTECLRGACWGEKGAFSVIEMHWEWDDKQKVGSGHIMA